MRASRFGIYVAVVMVFALALAGCRRGPVQADGGDPKDGGELLDAGGPGEDTGPDPVEDAGPDPVEDAGPDPVEDAGPTPPADAGPVEDAGNPPPVDAGPAGIAVRVGFVNGPITVQAGACSGAYAEVPRLRVAVLDGPGNEVTVTESVPVTLSSTSGTMRFFTDTACMQNVGSITIQPGQSGVNLTLEEDTSGEQEVIGSAPGLQQGRQTINVLP